MAGAHEYGLEWSAPISLVGDDLLAWRGRLLAPPVRRFPAARVAGVVVALALAGGASYTVVPGEMGDHGVRLIDPTATTTTSTVPAP
ncbi:MAG TPA: hypothetical protein VFZ83_07955 [Acidimicrobiia bacterium]|nr:hypothetical protein [Acidimicrobiia bacterium]